MEPATATIEGDLSIAQDSIAIPALSADPADAELVGLAAGVDSLAEVAPADTVCQALEAVELAVAEAANLAEGPAPVAEEPALGVTPVTPAPSTGKHYKLVVDALRQRIEPASDPAAVAGSGGWPGFSDYLGEGAKARLETVAALHLSPGAAELCPDAVRQLAANSSRILLGAATNCDLYQERLVRALARRVGARFLAVDAEVLHLGAGQLTGAEDGAGPSEGDEGGGAGAYDSSEDDFDDDVMDLTAKRGSSGKLHDEARALDAMRRMSRAARFVEHQVKKNVQEAGGGKETKKNGEEQAAEPAAPQVEAKRPDQGLDAKEVAAPNAERAVDGSKPATEAGGDGAKAAAAPEETAEVSSAQDIPDVAKKAMAEAEAFAARKFLAFTMSRRKTAVDKKPQAPDSRLKPADDRSVSLPGAGTLPEAGSLRHHILQMVRLSNEEKKGVQPGDRVCYVGPLRLARNGQYLPAFITDVCSRDPLDAQRKASSDAVSSKGPETGATGQVVSVSGGVLTVAMDEPFPGGMRLPGCKDGCGWTGSARQFSAMDDNKAAWNASFQALFDVIKEDVEAHGPLIVMVQAVDRMVRFAASYQYLQFRKLVATLPPKCLFVGAYTTSSLSREKAAAPSGLSIFFGRGGGRRYERWALWW